MAKAVKFNDFPEYLLPMVIEFYSFHLFKFSDVCLLKFLFCLSVLKEQVIFMNYKLYNRL